MVYGIILGGNLIDSNKVFLQPKRIMRTILWIICKPHFKTIGILAVP